MSLPETAQDSPLLVSSSFLKLVQSNGSLSLDDMLPCHKTVGVYAIEHVLLFLKKSRNFYDYKPPRNYMQDQALSLQP